LATRLAKIIPWDRVSKHGGVDLVFNCGKTEVGTLGETDIQVQAGWTGSAMTFHGYPIFRDSLRASLIAKAEQNNLSFVMDVSDL
jgi:hypothetical protein